MPLRQKVAIGSRIWWDGAAHCVTAFTGSILELRSERGQLTRIEAAELFCAKDFKILGLPDETTPGATFLDNVPEGEMKAAQILLGHLQEAVTGYQSGNATTALKTEPRPQFDPSTTSMEQRMKAKAQELGLGLSTLWHFKREHEQHGIFGLVDKRHLRNAIPFKGLDPRIREATLAILADITDSSNVSMNQIRRRVEREIKQKYPDEEIVFPSRPTFNRLIDELSRGKGTFGSAKARRSIDNRPPAPYRRFNPSRPGEIVLIDSTPFDAFALDPISFKWIQVQLTLAYDLYTRSMVAWRFTPVSTKAVDAALLLFDIIRPKLMRPGWPASARWPYSGIPEHIVIEIAGEEASGNGVAGIPFMHPETVMVDRGRVFISQAFKDACARLGINLQLARPYTPTDKAHVERVFRTIRERFIENLPGYKGPDVFSRGRDVEADSFLFLDEIEALFSEWVASYWQNRVHEGLHLPGAPLLKLSPNDMYEEGVARAGFVYATPDPNIYYDLLPTEWRTIQHYGIELKGLIYDGDILNDFRNATSPYRGVNPGKWPIRYDPRDLSQAYFYDHTLSQWHALPWTGAHNPDRAFNDATLEYVKTLVLAQGGNPRNREEVEQTLNDFLNRIDDSVIIGRKERKVAAVRAIQASRVQKDRPQAITPTQSLSAPDAEAELESWQGPLTGQQNLGINAEQHRAATSPTIQVFRTVDEGLDEDDIGF